MMKFTLKQKSWHFWLANFGEKRESTYGSDICSYVRSVMVGGFWFLFVALVGVALLGWALASFGNLIGWMFLDYQLEKYAFAFFMFFGGGTLLICSLIGIIFTKEHIENKLHDTKPGFVRLAYRSWKDKFCAKVEFK